MLVWLNGRLVPAATARVSALDRGLLHGDGVYETWRTYGGRPFAVAAHLRRMTAATRRLHLSPPGPPARWERLTRRLVTRNHLADAAVRLTVTRGAAGDALYPARRVPPTRLLTVRRLPPDLARRQAAGVAVVLLPFPREVAPAWGSLKLLGNASAVVGRLVIARRRADEGIYVNEAGEVTEGTTSNVFLLERDALVTPPIAAGLLPGVTRALVIALARGAGLRVREERVTPARLRAAAEAFLTASTVEILPVVRLDGRPLGGGRPGVVTRLLQARYGARVATTLGR